MTGADASPLPLCYVAGMNDKPLSPDLDKIELLPDAWERTERAIKAAVRRPPERQANRPPAKAKAKPAKAARKP